MTRGELERRIAELESQIAAYPYWGAALSAMDEERRGLKRSLDNQAASHGSAGQRQAASVACTASKRT